MTRLLTEAFEKAKRLPADLQDAIASDLIEMIDGDTRWERLLADPRSEAVLNKLAAEAIAEDERGETVKLRDRRGVSNEP